MGDLPRPLPLPAAASSRAPGDPAAPGPLRRRHRAPPRPPRVAARRLRRRRPRPGAHRAGAEGAASRRPRAGVRDHRFRRLDGRAAADRQRPRRRGDLPPVRPAGAVPPRDRSAAAGRARPRVHRALAPAHPRRLARGRPAGDDQRADRAGEPGAVPAPLRPGRESARAIRRPDDARRRRGGARAAARSAARPGPRHGKHQVRRLGGERA